MVMPRIAAMSALVLLTVFAATPAADATSTDVGVLEVTAVAAEAVPVVPCATDANAKTAVGIGTEWEIDDDVVMIGKLGNYVGTVGLDVPVDVCVFTLLGVGQGEIIAGASFSGDNALTGKCVRGNLGALGALPPATAGDYLAAGTIALVKIDLSYVAGDLVKGLCFGAKSAVAEIDCLGVFKAVPLAAVGLAPANPVEGQLVCHDDLPSNVGGK